MIHMLSAFEMRPGEDMTAFCTAYDAFVANLLDEDLIVSAGPLGTRVADTPMDTDEARPQTHFSILGFRDRAQLDAAYDALARHGSSATGSHHAINARITNSVFLCWQDLTTNADPSEKDL